jgi:hypothetical protein
VRWFVMAIGVLVFWRTMGGLWRLAKGRGRSVATQPLRRRPGRHRRPGDTRRRRVAAKRARHLVAMWAGGWPHDPVVHLSDGVVMRAGEVPLQRGTTHFWVWATQSTWQSHSQVRGWRRQVHCAMSEVSLSGWQERGPVTWLVTSARLYGRARNGETFSIWWACLESLEVDLVADRVVLGADGWKAQLTGPRVAPFAVVAVAACQGPAALSTHPGLARLALRAVA